MRNYANIEIYDSKEGHWGRGQTGFNLSLSGRVFLSDGRKIKVAGEWKYPSHRDLFDGAGDDETVYPGIYSYGFREGPTLWLYPHTESAMNDAMRRGLASLIGVHQINVETPVRSNSSRGVLFTLKEVDPVTGRLHVLSGQFDTAESHGGRVFRP